MIKRIALVLMSAVFIVGCAGEPPVAFGSTGKPLLESLRQAIAKKDAKIADRVLTLAQGNKEKGNMRSDEFDATRKICEYMKAGKWEEASKLAEGCATQTNKNISPTTETKTEKK
ncbi:hypothetical protein K2Y11_19185 [bacterium]|nr:hypothetical protein [bacterium]